MTRLARGRGRVLSPVPYAMNVAVGFGAWLLVALPVSALPDLVPADAVRSDASDRPLGATVSPSYLSTLASPFGECTTGYWSSNRNLDNQPGRGSASCEVIWKPRLSPNLRLGFDLRQGWQDQQQARGGDRRLREGYVEFDQRPVSLRLGRQILAWGRADRANPTDVLSPRDFTRLGVDDEDQRLGIDAGRLRLALSPVVSLTGVVARFTPHVTPQGSLPANLVPAQSPDRTEWAIKLDHTGQGVDGSLSYFQGFDRFVRYRLDPSSAAPLFRGDYERARIVGADLASAQGAWTWRAEVSSARFSANCEGCGQTGRRVDRAVAGVDRDLHENLNLNVQVFANHRPDYQAPPASGGLPQTVAQGLNRLNSEYARREYGLTIRLSDRILNEKFKWEVNAVLDLSGGSRVIRPRLSYAVNDRVRISAGADLYSGATQSYFGTLRNNRLGFVMLGLVF